MKKVIPIIDNNSGNPTVAAENDALFAKTAVALKDTLIQTTVPFETTKYKQEKPIFFSLCKPRSPHEVLAYPGHPEFRKRVDFVSWKKFNADFHQEISLNKSKYKAMYKTLGYYNKVLFHPLLIDAQVFCTNTKEDGKDTQDIYISFLIAHSLEEFQNFPRPEPGKSSGYYLFPGFDYFLAQRTSFPKKLPSFTPTFKTLYQHTPELLAQEPLPMAEGCCGYFLSQERLAMRPRAYSFQELQQRCVKETSVSTVPSEYQEEERKEEVEDELRKGAVISPQPSTTGTGITAGTTTDANATIIHTQATNPDTHAHSHGVLRVPLPGMVPIPSTGIAGKESPTDPPTDIALPDIEPMSTAVGEESSGNPTASIALPEYEQEQVATSETMLRE